MNDKKNAAVLIKELFIATCIAAPLVAFGIITVCANYIGPANRTATTNVNERLTCFYRAYLDGNMCYMTLYESPTDSCMTDVAGYFNPSPQACGAGWPGDCKALGTCTILTTSSIDPCTPGDAGCTSNPHTSSLPPATVSGVTACSLTGSNGWCRGKATLALSGSEPVGGYSLTYFERNQGVLCNAPACIWTFPEGLSSFNYWVHSTFGDTSTALSVSMKVDSLPPSVTLAIPSPNGQNGWSNSAVTASASATDASSGVASVSINGGGSTFTASTDGTYNLAAVARDVAGNTTTASGSFKIDGTPPTLALLLPQANGPNGWFVSGPVTATASAADATSGVAGISINGGGSTFTTSTDGTYTLTAVARDAAGNSTTTSGSFKIDGTPPTLAILLPQADGSNGWFVSGPVTVSASASDAFSGVASVSINGGGSTFTASADGIYSLTATAADNAGNGATASGSFRIDGTPPTLAILLPQADGSNGWFVSGPVTATASAEDVTSGLAGVSINDGGSTFTASTDGTYNLAAVARDAAGNTASYSSVLRLDSTPPISGFTLPSPDGQNGWYVSPVTVMPNGSDATSGIASQEVSPDQAAWSSSVTISTDGTYTVYERLSDLAGNTTAATTTVQMDTMPPSVTVSMPSPNGSGWYKTIPVTVTASTADGVSGVGSVQVSVDGGAFQPGSSISLSTDGAHTVVFKVSDNAGNSTSSAAQTVDIDTTPPTVSVSLPAPQGLAGWYTDGLQFSSSGNDTGSGLQGVDYSLDGGATWQASPPSLVEGRYSILTRVTDLAGNITNSTNTVNVDPTPPQSAFTTPKEGRTTTIHGIFTLKGQTSDLTSGPATAEISLGSAGSSQAGSGQAWQPLALTGETWAYTWDTTRVPNGTYTLLVRASDAAGNEEHTAEITVVVANQGPQVSITQTWWVWEQAEISIQDGSLPVAGGQIIISDGKGHTRTYDFNYDNIPSDFLWDGTWDEGTYAAPGEYPVLVSAWDDFGNTGQDSGTVRIPRPAPSVTTAPPADIAPAAALPLATVAHAPQIIPQAVPPLPTPEPRPAPQPPAAAPAYTWPAAGLIGLLAVLASSSLSDKRPSALRRLEKAIPISLSGPEENKL